MLTRLGRGEVDAGAGMTKVRISEDALADLNEGFLFYESQEAGLGDYFIATIRADIEGLKVTAGVHRIAYRDFHRLIGKTFPYGVFYTFASDIADVWAVIDLRQDPSWIVEHLDAKGAQKEETNP